LLWQTEWTRKVTCFVSKFPTLSHGAGYHLTPKRRQHSRYSSTPGSFARETPCPTYEYTNLPGRRWIRLLEIPAPPGPDRAADTGTPLSCRLVNALMDKKPGYESSYDALSYSWDDQVSDRILHLRDETDGTPRQLFVTKNCEDAIRALQRSLSLHREKPYRIWIDAISINQANLQERNSQVSMMEDIYGSAFCVRIWLGHATHDSYAAMRVLLRMASDKTLSPDKLPDIGKITLRAFLIRHYLPSDSTQEEHRSPSESTLLATDMDAPGGRPCERGGCPRRRRKDPLLESGKRSPAMRRHELLSVGWTSPHVAQGKESTGR
jgi:hypothetical protein